MLKRPLLTRRRVKVLSLLAGLGMLAWLGLSFYVAYQLTRRSRPIFPQPAPAVSWAKLEDVRLTTSDGLGIGAWYAPGRPNLPAVVLLHGNRGSRESTLWLAEILAARGHGILALSLRAHGDSDGEVNDFGRSAASDVIAAVEFLEKRSPGVPIVVRGGSLGAAAAIFAADDLGDRVSGYVLECPYRDLRSAVWNRVQLRLPLVANHMAYAGLNLVAPLLLDDIDGISPKRAIEKFPQDIPMLIMAGSFDSVAPVDQAEELHCCVASHCEFVVFERAGHGRFRTSDPEKYDQALFGFLKRFEKAESDKTSTTRI